MIMMGYLDREPEHRVFATANTLSARTGQDRKTVLLNLKRLEHAGLITRLREKAMRGGAPNFVLNVTGIEIPVGDQSSTENGITSSPANESEVVPNFPRSGTAFPTKSTQISAEVNPKVGHRVEKDLINKKKREMHSSRKTRMSDRWTLTPELLTWTNSTKPGLDVQTVLANFRDHYIAKGELRASWPASWRTWVRRERIDAHRRPNQSFESLDYGKTGDLL